MMPDTPPPVKRSWTSLWSTNPITMAFATVGLVAVVGLVSVVLRVTGITKSDFFIILSDSDEAPIRVRNGSLDLSIVGLQRWEQIGSSGSWRIWNATRHREEFEVTIASRAGATCGGALTATGSDVVLTYKKDDNAASSDVAKIVMQSAGRRTVVKPDTGVTMTWDASDPTKLLYKVTGGYLQSIAVGNGANPATICTFHKATELDHVLILNVP